MQRSLFVNRETYDKLVRQFPAWMRDCWPRYRRHWNIGGVMVYAHEGYIENLQIQISQLQTEHRHV